MLKDFKNQILALLKSKTGKNISLTMSSNVLSSAFGFAGSIVVLRQCSEEILGIIYSLIGLMMISAQVLDLGFTQTFIKVFNEKDADKTKIASTTLFFKIGLATIGLVLGFVFSVPLERALFGEGPKYQFYIHLTLVVIFIQILGSFFSTKLQAEHRFKQFSLTRSLPHFLKFSLLVSLLFLDKIELLFVYIAFVFVPLFTFLLSLFRNFNNLAVRAISSTKVKEIWSISKWVFLASVVNTFLGQTDILMVRSIVGESELATLLGGQKLASAFPLLLTSLLQVLLPKVSSMKGRKELNYFIRKSFFVTIPIIISAIPLFFFSGTLVQILIGERYFESAAIFNVYSFGFLMSFLSTPLSLVLIRLNKEKELAIMNSIQLVLNITLNYLFISQWGALAAAGSTMTIKAFSVLFIAFLLYRNRFIFRGNYEENIN